MSVEQIIGNLNDIIKVGFWFDKQDVKEIDGVKLTDYIFCYLEIAFLFKNMTIVDQSDNALILTISGYSLSAVKAEVEAVWDILKPSSFSVFSIYDITAGDPVEGGDIMDDMSEDEYYSDTPEQIEAGMSGSSEDEVARKELVNNVLVRLDELIEVPELQTFVKDLIAISTTKYKASMEDVMSRSAMLMSINGGCGYSTYLDIISDTLSSTALMPIVSGIEPIEIRKAVPDEEVLDEITRYDKRFNVVAIDLTFRMNEVETAQFRDFIRKIYEKKYPSTFIVFKIPYVDATTRDKVESVISSVFPLFTIDVPPFSLHQYFRYAKQYAKSLSATFDRKAFDEVEELIIYELNRSHFYGFKTINKLVEEIIYEKCVTLKRSKTNMTLHICEDDLKPIIEKRFGRDSKLETLDDLIGVDEIRERIDEIVVQLELALNNPDAQRPCMHMIFTGNPGTGKTTVARILGRILKEKGVLSKGQFFEHSGRDFVGRYIGETAPKTNAICQDAYGSILFIDEAYTLFRGVDDERDFGREAIDALITQMENHRNDFIVIMSGYAEQMNKMFDANPGLKSRIPHEITFRNFTREEMIGIFMNMVKKNYSFEPELEEAVGKYFKALSDEKLSDEHFANARFVRNLYERTVTKAALRVSGTDGERIKDPTKIVLTKTDFERASESEEFNKMQEKKHMMGFV